MNNKLKHLLIPYPNLLQPNIQYQPKLFQAIFHGCQNHIGKMHWLSNTSGNFNLAANSK